MIFSFVIPKPYDIKSTLMSTEKNITAGGGIFSGDEKSGRFSGKGVSGIYNTGDDFIKITITKKPPLYSASSVKSAIERYFSLQ